MNKATIFDLVRMCTGYDGNCKNCPLDPCIAFIADSTDKASEIVLNWCKEHPVETRQEMSSSKSEMDRILEICKHTIGLDYKKPYHRHGKAFYKPYRNFFCTSKDDTIWNRLCAVGIAKRSEEHNGCVDFYLTRVGVEWLSRQLKITIKGTGLE